MHLNPHGTSTHTEYRQGGREGGRDRLAGREGEREGGRDRKGWRGRQADRQTVS